MSPAIFDSSSLTQKNASKVKPLNVPAKFSSTFGKQRDPNEYSSVLRASEPTKNGFASYAPLPVGLSFESQQENEHVLLFLRQHPIVNVPWMLISIGMFFAPFLIEAVIPFVQQIPARYFFVLTLSWYLLTLGYIFERFLMWLFNSFIITDERMIDIDFYSLVYKQMDYAKLDKIQDISTQTGGVLFSLLDVGNILVQTASEVPIFVFDNISHPSLVVKLLNELVQEEERESYEERVN
ncbi:MAG: hypothetical protein UX04_C0002G0093 [Microgenomates group bacterium GW2011_GWF2_45_18]|nr:MAG: hypothetical protein UW18_C0001G0004 [Microgenomates group bacterium GW2011_GWF1_44_10]KKU01950.1 MAG: hypothetical protein UX04_C0002G0093 [Microgenomates group bacterium GW2011_GWF2_45_18]OGJ41474.1 MAG: hypothetical protein A2378_00105 [Candidatus Pacebacteria bacterium RIFOXYB1_FULL_44_10]HAU98737.1 hypothetical protein [Candidatus Paceibacterota bacterium]HAX01443.1 hypothetical protein [Candidatus Paceibacterota bacterium]